jgi:hypothetical protein
MILHAASDNAPSLLLVEGGLTFIAVAAAYAWPKLGNSWFARVERAFTSLARKQGLAVATVGLGTLLLRLAILPLFPVPLPFDPNDFSNLLAADTFAHGHLANPTPAMWTHLEAVHVDMQPTYGSMYFPGEGLMLAAGKVLFGCSWLGILIAGALMCAALCWMLQAWLPPGWALLGGILAMLRIGLFSYWTNTYTGAGVLGGLGGALVLGAMPRLMKTASIRYGLLMAVGIVLLIYSRPYEGLLLCLPVAFVLVKWAIRGKNRPAPVVLLRRAALPVLIVLAGCAWFGYYNYSAFGRATTLPYTVNRAAYAMAPYYIWQPPRPQPHYRHELMRRFYYEIELTAYDRIHSLSGYLPINFQKIVATILFFAGLALFPPIFLMRRVFLDKRMRFLVISVLILMVGNLIMIYMIPHYLAPFTAVFYALGLQAMRHLCFFKPEGRAMGRALVRSIVVICVLMAGIRLFAAPLGFQVSEWSATQWEGTWIGPEHFGVERAQIETSLEQTPGKQLVFVRYGADHPPGDQWIYNSANIDASKVVWAWDMGPADNRELMQYYGDRQVWLVEPDAHPISLSPYREPPQAVAAAH